MLDLSKLEKEIDALLESETEETLSSWLFNKRFGALNKILGTGTFVSLKSQNSPIFNSYKGHANYTSGNNTIPNTPINRQAA